MTSLSLSLSTVPLLGLDGNSWSHLRPNGSGLHAAFPRQIPSFPCTHKLLHPCLQNCFELTPVHQPESATCRPVIFVEFELQWMKIHKLLCIYDISSITKEPRFWNLLRENQEELQHHQSFDPFLPHLYFCPYEWEIW
jgi:hypothetical protein